MTATPRRLASLCILAVLLAPLTTATFDDVEPSATQKGAVTVAAQTHSGVLDKLAYRLGQGGLLSSINTELGTYQPGDEVTIEVSDVAESACTDSTFVVEFYAPEPPSDAQPEAKGLDYMTGYDPVSSSQLVSAGVTNQLPDDAAEGEWTIVAYLFCHDNDAMIGGTDDVAKKTFTVDASTGTGGDDQPTTTPPAVVAYREPTTTVSDGRVSTTVFLENRGGSAMSDTDIVEMQVRPQGRGLLSFVSGQRTCDPNHPENVHKQYQLDAGGQQAISLSTTAIDPGQRYDVWVTTRDACYPDHARVLPYPNGRKVRDGVCVGDCGQTDTSGGDDTQDGGVPWLTIGLAGVVIVLFGAGGWLVIRDG